MRIKRKKLDKSKSAPLYRLEGQGKKFEKRLPGDGVAISWACGILAFRENDKFPRPGEEVPLGDYKLTLVGDAVNEPIFNLRKHDVLVDRVIVSWEAA